MTSPENMLVHEIIGLWAKIVESTDPTLKEVSGSIVSETKNMISIRTDSSVKQIAKQIAKKIEIKTHIGGCFISGSSLIGRPEDRISRLHS
ncbi:MAG TPA: ribonuclease P protein subunit [Nitrososphaera sp.]|jgi:ribonuclease P protein subunit POP4|nr:ribonuclease P protein subunit [Nitrososphaera sp.]